jgi:hypothetical protein
VTWLAAMCALLAVTGAIVTGQAISPKRNRWWRDPATQQQLALSREQIDRLEAIFNRDLHVRIELYNEITRLDTELRRTIELGEVDDNALMRLIDELETVRRQRNTRVTVEAASAALIEKVRTARPNLASVQGFLVRARDSGPPDAIRSVLYFSHRCARIDDHRQLT